MTELQAMHMVRGAPMGITNFDDPYWKSTDPLVLNSCFDKGFLRWVNGRLTATPLGVRSCGGGLR